MLKEAGRDRKIDKIRKKDRKRMDRVRREINGRGRKKRQVDWYILLTPVFAVVAVIAMIACFFTIAYYEKKETKAEQEAQEALAMASVTFTQEEVDLMVDTAVSAAVEEAVQASNEDFLGKMRKKMENGDSTVSMLREFYPEQIVLYDKGKYLFKDILDTLKHNSLSVENIRADEESGEITYVNGEEVISKKGIDVSKYQGEINWNKVANDGVEYAFLRLGIRGYGTGEIVLDTTFEDNAEGALKEGIDVGAYFFTQAVNEEEAKEEADFVIEALAPYEISYPVVIDVEDVDDAGARTNDLTAEERTALVKVFCDRIREAGYTPMIYGNLKTFMLMLDITQLEDYEKWYAFYSTEEFYYPYDFSIWQYSDSGAVSGIEKGVDMNISFKTWE